MIINVEFELGDAYVLIFMIIRMLGVWRFMFWFGFSLIQSGYNSFTWICDNLVFKCISLIIIVCIS